MTPQNAKEYLQQYRKCMNRILSIQEHIDELRTLCTRMTPPYGSGGECHTAASDKLGAMVASLVDAESEAANEICVLKATLTQVKNVIYQVKDKRLLELLYLRYICGNTWEQIAVSMQYSYVHVVHRLHPAALRVVCNIMREK